MRLPLWIALTFATTALAGCQGGSDPASAPAPTAQPPRPTTPTGYAPGGDRLGDGAALAQLGAYQLTLDVAAQQADLTQARAGSATDDIYLLGIDQFLNADSLKLVGVGYGADTVDLRLRFTHPFAAPTDLDAPATAKNRADLGVAARILLGADLPGAADPADFTFFQEGDGDNVIANTDLVPNADGYYNPAGTVPILEPLTADTFPYKLVVDEASGADGNRIGLSNGGSGIGNYNPTGGGWQRPNMGATRDQWTGYGYIHQGQSSEVVMQLDADMLLGESIQLNMIVVAKYIDPRGGVTVQQKRANRLPGAIVDTTKFVYRMPYGAIDGESVWFLAESGGLEQNNDLSTTTLDFYVVDADARATETSQADLSQDTDPALVQNGTSGLGSLFIDIPGVTDGVFIPELPVANDDTAYGGDVGLDSGVARDSLFYRGTIFNGISTGQTSGVKRGLARFNDVEGGVDTTLWEFDLDPNLVPLSTNKPRLITYGAFTVTVDPGAGNGPPNAFIVLQSGVINSGDPLTYTLQLESDPDGDPVTYAIDYDYSGTFVPDIAGLDPATPPTILHTSPGQFNPGPTDLDLTTRVQYSDGVNPPEFQDLNYTLLGGGACVPQEHAFTFDTDNDGWSVQGTNQDGPDFGHLRRGCFDIPTENAMPGALLVNYLTSGDDTDDDDCLTLDDYGTNADFSFASPVINIPPTCTPGSVKVVFNAFLDARATATAQLAYSTDLGKSYQPAVWSQIGTVVGQAFVNESVTLPDALAGTSIRLRFRFTDPETSDLFITSDGLAAGLTLDNVRVQVESSAPITTIFNPVTGTCGTVTETHGFDDGNGWQGGQFFGLPNGDVEAPEPELGGFGSFRWTDCASTTDPNGTYAAVLAQSAGAITTMSLNCTSDETGTECGDFLYDYAAGAIYNVVSPRFAVATPCGGNTVSLIFNAFLRTDEELGGFDPAVLRAYVQTDDGGSWGTPIWSATAQAGGQTFSNQTVNITAASTLTGFVRIRFEFVSTSAADVVATPGVAFGAYIDEVRLEASNGSSGFVAF